jgi:GNAT superfamily N-acetyltransferase
MAVRVDPLAPMQDELRRATVADAPVVASWPQFLEESEPWVTAKLRPVPPDQVVGWWEPDYVEPWVMVSGDGRLLAYGELWIDPQEDEVELARLVVAPEVRGQGLGKRLVRALCDKAVATGLHQLIIRVRAGNDIALHCYRSSGFQDVDPSRRAEWNVGQRQEYIWLERPEPT